MIKIVSFLSLIRAGNLKDVLLLMKEKGIIVPQKLIQRELWSRTNGPVVMKFVKLIVKVYLAIFNRKLFPLRI